LRTHACNLLCGAGKYAKESTWTCDTIPVFTKIQKHYTAEELFSDWETRGWITELTRGTHLVITGGEPLILERQEQLIPFLKMLKDPFIEVETNGTICPSPALNTHIAQYNVSPKLTSSGMPKAMRFVPEVIQWHCQNPRSFFKFVVTNKEDVRDLTNTYITPFNIPLNRVWLMPGAATRKTLLELQPTIAQLAKESGMNFCSRLHILLYDQTTGV